MTKFQQAINEALASELPTFIASASIAYADEVEAFAEEVVKRGPFQAMRWKAESLLAAEMQKDLASVVGAVLSQEESTPAEAVEAGTRYLRSQVDEGIRSTWSGYITNEAAKARAKAALDLESHGKWSNLVSGARYTASFTIAPRTRLNTLMSEYREAVAKGARVKSDASRAKAVAEIESLKVSVEAEIERINLTLEQAGAPEEVFSSMRLG